MDDDEDDDQLRMAAAAPLRVPTPPEAPLSLLHVPQPKPTDAVGTEDSAEDESESEPTATANQRRAKQAHKRRRKQHVARAQAAMPTAFVPPGANTEPPPPAPSLLSALSASSTRVWTDAALNQAPPTVDAARPATAADEPRRKRAKPETPREERPVCKFYLERKCRKVRALAMPLRTADEKLISAS